MNTSESGKNKYLVPAVEKAFTVLEFIINSNTGCTFKDIIDELEIPKTTAFTVLNSLVHCGYVEKTEEKLFVPTIKIYSIGMKARKSIIKSHIFAGSLKNLRNATGFTVFFSIYDKGEKVVIEKIDGYGAIQFRAVEGERGNLNTSAAGKAIAAYLDNDELELILSKGLVKVTDNSISDEKEFLEHLKLVREQGYAMDNGEDDISLRCLGMPIFMNGNMIFGSVSISTTKETLPLDKIPQYLSILRLTADNISLKLGFEGNYDHRLKQR
jgi:DNA-binding IclR family transcriptional regulator